MKRFGLTFTADGQVRVLRVVVRWGRYDRIMIGLARRGIAPILTIFSSPRWAARGPEAADRRPVNPNAPDPRFEATRYLAQLAVNIVARVYEGLGGRSRRFEGFERWKRPEFGSMTRPHGRRAPVSF